MPTRRNFLKTAAMLTGAAGFAAGMPDAIRKAYAIAPDPENPKDLDTTGAHNLTSLAGKVDRKSVV